MSKLGCRCGAVISDGTDDLPYKAHAVLDQDVERLFDEVERFAESFAMPRATAPDSDVDWVENTLGRVLVASRTVYECEACGRLAVEMNDGRFAFYSPDSGKPNRPFEVDRPRAEP